MPWRALLLRPFAFPFHYYTSIFVETESIHFVQAVLGREELLGRRVILGTTALCKHANIAACR
jgi:hypothetical protein